MRRVKYDFGKKKSSTRARRIRPTRRRPPRVYPARTRGTRRQITSHDFGTSNLNSYSLSRNTMQWGLMIDACFTNLKELSGNLKIIMHAARKSRSRISLSH
jgi:hypothetical protein